MEFTASSRELPAYVESAEPRESHAGREGIGLGALVVLLAPVGLAAWLAIGVAVYRAVT
jgi:hypothetical protein